jgi:hypothetical protein
MKFITDDPDDAVHMSLKVDDDGDVALMANGHTLLWVMRDQGNISMCEGYGEELTDLGFTLSELGAVAVRDYDYKGGK